MRTMLTCGGQKEGTVVTKSKQKYMGEHEFSSTLADALGQKKVAAILSDIIFKRKWGRIEQVARQLGADLSDKDQLTLVSKLVEDELAKEDREAQLKKLGIKKGDFVSPKVREIARQIGADLDNPDDLKVVEELAKKAA